VNVATVSAAHQELCDLGREGDRDEPLVVAVADGLGGHVAGTQASQLVLTRLRDASARLDDPDRIQAVLDDTSRALEHAAAHANDPDGARRGATTAGFVLIPPRDERASLDAIWFSVGDCLLLSLERAPHDPEQPHLRMLCEPAVGPNGTPNRAMGADGLSVPYTGRVPVGSEALLLCCTDGFATSFGIATDWSLCADRLAERADLRPIWQGLLRGPGDPEDDRKAVEALCAAALEAARRLPAQRHRTDDVSLALARTQQEGAS
jgi:serine/threonine protein phosphatase PrpC